MLVILFDHRPKETRRDLYDREEELSALHSASSEPIILLTGVRRIGKTSVLKVFLNELEVPHALVDVRLPLTSYKSLYSLFSDILSQINKKKSIKSYVEHINGISILGVNISLSWDPRDKPSLLTVMDNLNQAGRVILAFDEAQNLRGKLSNEFLSLIAHCYDYCRNMTFVLTGSEIGLLYDFLKMEDPSSPLYGRHVEEIRLNKFNEQESLDFVNYPALTDGASPPRDGDFLLLRATSIPLHPQRRFHRTEPFCNAPCGRGVTEGLLSTSFSSPSPKGTTSALTARGLYIYLFFSIKRFL